MRTSPYEIVFLVLIFIPLIYVIYYLVISNFRPEKWNRFYAKHSGSPSFFSRFLGFSVPLSCLTIASLMGSILYDLFDPLPSYLFGGLATCGFSVIVLRSFSNSMQGLSLRSFLNWSAITSTVLFASLFSSAFIDISSVFASAWILIPWAVTAIFAFKLKKSHPNLYIYPSPTAVSDCPVSKPSPPVIPVPIPEPTPSDPLELIPPVETPCAAEKDSSSQISEQPEPSFQAAPPPTSNPLPDSSDFEAHTMHRSSVCISDSDCFVPSETLPVAKPKKTVLKVIVLICLFFLIFGTGILLGILAGEGYFAPTLEPTSPYIESNIESARKDGRRIGYSEGYKAGVEVGREAGESSGYSNGYSDGYNRGYYAGFADCYDAIIR